jgi:hypothetical protein
MFIALSRLGGHENQGVRQASTIELRHGSRQYSPRSKAGAELAAKQKSKSPMLSLAFCLVWLALCSLLETLNHPQVGSGEYRCRT